MENRRPTRLAMVGCGAVVEFQHLPAAGRVPDFELVLLVDRDLDRARRLSSTYGGVAVSDDYRQVKDSADAALLALPHHLHAEVACELLDAGVHVLVEKPMAMTVEECRRMIDSADRAGVVLAVGLMRRFLYSLDFLADTVANETFGKLQEFEMLEGNVYDWPVVSDFFLRKETAGGGVLFDTGAHTIDALLSIFGDLESFEYRDDSYGGVEADCELDVVTVGGARGHIELSRTRGLSNSIVARFERAEVVASLVQNLVSIRPLERDRKAVVCQGYDPSRISEKTHLLKRFDQQPNGFDMQLIDWARAIREGGEPRISGREGARSIEVIEECYRKRRPLDLPWLRFGAATEGNER